MKTTQRQSNEHNVITLLVFSLDLNKQNQAKTASSDENIIKQEMSIETLSLLELLSNRALTSCS